MTICMSITDTKNVGDLVCNPALYYPGLGKIKDIDDHGPIDQHDNVIYGGGAILNRAIRSSHRQSCKSILWGAGDTIRGAKSHSPRFLSQFDLAGIRDYHEFSVSKWVPCVSCKSELFDEVYTPTHDIVYYGHRSVMPLSKHIPENAPYMDNEERTFQEVIQFLGSGDTVVTSSYHGVYWATLLGKKVICIPFGSKFHYFKHKPTYINVSDLSAIRGFITYTTRHDDKELLQEYRAVNDNFNNKVTNLLS